jgi:sugar phosphate isomerase/epimerase
MQISRRKFLGTTVMATTALSVLPAIPAIAATEDQQSKTKPAGLPNSRFAGIQIGTITYSWRDLPSGAEDIIKYCKEAGVSSLELMGDVIESYAGIPPSPTELPAQLSTEEQSRLDGMLKSANLTLEQLKKAVEPPVWQMIVAGVIGTTAEQKQWRQTVPMDKFVKLRKMFNDAGIDIHIAKLSPANWSDAEIDYAFRVAKALGAKGITEEAGIDAAKRLGPFAAKHKMYAIFHNHFQFADKNFNVDQILAASPANMLNFDCGHYFGSTGLDPVEFIKKYHKRIFSIHLKDKTGPTTEPANANQVWGQGETPLAGVLKLLKQHAAEPDWPKYGDIELEYTVPKWSNTVKEVKTCVAYCRGILI